MNAVRQTEPSTFERAKPIALGLFLPALGIAGRPAGRPAADRSAAPIQPDDHLRALDDARDPARPDAGQHAGAGVAGAAGYHAARDGEDLVPPGGVPAGEGDRDGLRWDADVLRAAHPRCSVR